MAEHHDDPPEFDRTRVPDGAYAEFFYDGRTGRGLTNVEYDETIARLRVLADGPDPDTAAAAREMLAGIRGTAG